LTKDDNTFKFNGKKVHLGHPREIADLFANTLMDQSSADWFN